MKQYLWYENWRHIFIKTAAIITRTAMKQSVKLNNTLYEQFKPKVSLCALYVYSTVWSIIWKLSMVCTSRYSCSNKISSFFLSSFFLSSSSLNIVCIIPRLGASCLMIRPHQLPSFVLISIPFVQRSSTTLLICIPVHPFPRFLSRPQSSSLLSRT